MTGFSVELKYPNHKNSASTLLLSVHEVHNGIISAARKNGSQQTTNAPVIIASVLAAFRSRFASSVSLRALTLLCGFAMPPVGTCFCCCLSATLLIGFCDWLSGCWTVTVVMSVCLVVTCELFTFPAQSVDGAFAAGFAWWWFVFGDGGTELIANWFWTEFAAVSLVTPSVVSFSWSFSRFVAPTTCCDTVKMMSLDDDVGP